MIANNKKPQSIPSRKPPHIPTFLSVGVLVSAVEFHLKTKKNERGQGLYFSRTLW